MRMLPWIGLAILAVTPLLGLGNYPLHLLIMVLLWGYVSTSCSFLGGLGVVGGLAGGVQCTVSGLPMEWRGGTG